MAAKTASLSVNIIADAAKARAGLKEAETAFGRFRQEVGNAQGAMGKFQAVGGAALNYVKANAIAFATSAGAAIGAFVVKSVIGFQNLALAAGKFSDATGLSTQEASRFIEVAGDIGIEASSVEKAIGFMNKTLGNSPNLFRELGVQIEYASNGATDVNGTFLNIIQRLNEIEDPAQRSAAATKLLGRGWMDLAEMVGMGADQLAASLASVSEAKVIDPKELENARRLRDATDQLKDSWENFANNIGSKLVPALSDAADAANILLNIIGKLPGDESLGAIASYKKAWEDLKNTNDENWFSMGGLDAIMKILTGNTEKSYKVTDQLARSWQYGYRAMIDARGESERLAYSLTIQAENADEAKNRWDEYRNNLSIKQQSLSVQQSIEEFRAKWANATDEAKRKSREYQYELMNNQAAVANLALSIVGLATTAQNTRIQFYIDTGQLQQAYSLIRAIQAGMNKLAGAITPDRVERVLEQAAAPPPPPRTSTTTAPKSTAAVPKPPAKSPIEQLGAINKTKRIPGIAGGGTITAGGLALVGEYGPELVTLPRGASVIPNIPSRKMMGGGTVYNIQIQAGLVSSPDQVGQQIIEAIRRTERQSGNVFASVR